MGELTHYFTTLRGRGLSIARRELASRFIRGPVKTAVRRVMDACERYGAAFTFYITGNTIMANPEYVREILARGHAVECHGYNHIRFDIAGPDDIRLDLDVALEVFQTLCGHHPTCFRAPYLGMSETVAEVLKEKGFLVSSSIMGDTPSEYACGLAERPISACDWHSLIRDDIKGEAFCRELLDKQRDGAVFELHPWRMGQKKYLWILEEFLAAKTMPAVSQLEQISSGGIALTGDLGEFGIAEVLGRAVFKKHAAYDDVRRALAAMRESA